MSTAVEVPESLKVSVPDAASRRRVNGTWIILAAALLVAGSPLWFMNTDVGRSLTAEQERSALDRSGVSVSAVQYERFEAARQRQAYVLAVLSFTAFAVTHLLLAGGVFVALTRMANGCATFSDVQKAVGVAALVLGAGQVFRYVVSYGLGDLSVSTSLGFVNAALGLTGFGGHLLNAVDVFGLMWAAVLATALARAYGRWLSSCMAMTFGIYLAIASAKALVKVLVGAPL